MDIKIPLVAVLTRAALTCPQSQQIYQPVGSTLYLFCIEHVIPNVFTPQMKGLRLVSTSNGPASEFFTSVLATATPPVSLRESTKEY